MLPSHEEAAQRVFDDAGALAESDRNQLVNGASRTTAFSEFRGENMRFSAALPAVTRVLEGSAD
jgi:hypothetical protein